MRPNSYQAISIDYRVAPLHHLVPQPDGITFQLLNVSQPELFALHNLILAQMFEGVKPGPKWRLLDCFPQMQRFYPLFFVAYPPSVRDQSQNQ